MITEKQIAEGLHIGAGKEGVQLVKHAREYALKMHGDQKYGDKPYSVHLEDVESVLIEFGHFSSFLLAAALLHDVREDANVNKEEFEQEFPDVAMIVEAVTSEPGKNRAERNTKTYPKISGNLNATILKLADRISNVRNAKATGDSKYEMYKKEYPEFRSKLYIPTSETMMDYRAGLISQETLDIAFVPLPMWLELDCLLEYQIGS